jgi:cysteine desulfuration protein SufE
MTAAIPPELQDIASDFDLLDSWEDRYRYVMELGRAMPDLPEAMKTDANKVRGCASQVWLVTSKSGATNDPTLHFQGDSDAHIVRGLVAILLKIVQDQHASTIAALDPMAIFATLGLKEHLTPQRANGLASMVQRIKADAQAALGA